MKIKGYITNKNVILAKKDAFEDVMDLIYKGFSEEEIFLELEGKYTDDEIWDALRLADEIQEEKAHEYIPPINNAELKTSQPRATQLKNIEPDSSFIFSDERARPFAKLMEQVFYLGKDGKTIWDTEKDEPINYSFNALKDYNVLSIEYKWKPPIKEKVIKVNIDKIFEYDEEEDLLRGRFKIDGRYFLFASSRYPSIDEITIPPELEEEIINEWKEPKAIDFIKKRLTEQIKALSPSTIEKVKKKPALKKELIEEDLAKLFNRFRPFVTELGRERDILFVKTSLKEFLNEAEKVGIDSEYFRENPIGMIGRFQWVIEKGKVGFTFFRKLKFDKKANIEIFKGIYVIQKHYAKKAGKHFDIRFEVPISLTKGLKKYKEKRKEKTPEPISEKGETVLFSFVSKQKEPLPKAGSFYVIETEPHPKEYAKFEGTIPEESYGAGKVEIFDKGDYNLYEFKKSTIKLEIIKGKFKGEYTFVKMGDSKIWKVYKKKK